MVNFNKLQSIETYICKNTSILEEDISEELIEYYIQGYLDYIESKKTNTLICKVEYIRSLEEYSYMLGYRVANFDYDVEETKMFEVDFTTYYKELIKILISIQNLPNTIVGINSWILQLRELRK